MGVDRFIKRCIYSYLTPKTTQLFNFSDLLRDHLVRGQASYVVKPRLFVLCICKVGGAGVCMVLSGQVPCSDQPTEWFGRFASEYLQGWGSRDVY